MGNLISYMEYHSATGTCTIEIPHKNRFSIILVSKNRVANLYCIIYGQIIPIVENNDNFSTSIDDTGRIVTITSLLSYYQIGVIKTTK